MYALASGLMEITYDTGAKVILQGPVTYEVESAAGGYLSVGKLTAKLEKKGGKSPNLQISKSETSNPQSLIPTPLFVIRTPTVTVTDLGTEFGVEVNKQGGTTSHVFRGSVRLQVAPASGETETMPVFCAKTNRPTWRTVARDRIVVLGPFARPANFVREISRQTIKTLDLVDVVAGGDGFSGRRGRGIDPTSGQLVDTPVKDATGKQSREMMFPATDDTIALKKCPMWTVFSFLIVGKVPCSSIPPVTPSPSSSTPPIRQPSTCGRVVRFSRFPQSAYP